MGTPERFQDINSQDNPLDINLGVLARRLLSEGLCPDTLQRRPGCPIFFLTLAKFCGKKLEKTTPSRVRKLGEREREREREERKGRRKKRKEIESRQN